VGTALLIIIAVAIAGVAWFMLDRVAQEKLSQDAVHVGFATDHQARTARVVDFSQPMEWGTDLLVAGSCTASLNGGNITGDVVVGDLLSCANAGELRVSTSPDLGGKLLYRIVFQ
jgi:hypothetical protein